MTLTERRIEFDCPDVPGAGYSFEADENWNLLPFKNEAAKENYEKCSAGAIFVSGPFRRVFEREIVEPAVGKCEKCGAKVILVNHFLGACHCGNCGQWYNLWGQPLLSPQFWDNDDDENYGPVLRGE